MPRARAVLVGWCLLAAAPARAEAPRLRLGLEAGTELDTNPHRDEGSDLTQPTAGVARGAARLQLGWRPRPGQALRLAAVAAGKKFTPDGEADEEDVAVVTGDLRYEVALGERPLSLGGRVTYYDAFERDTVVAGRSQDRDFRTGDGSLALTLLGEGDHRVVASAGYRLFQYKPNRAFDFGGEYAGLAYAHAFALGDPDAEADARSIDLGVQYAAHRRRYRTDSINNVCPDDGTPSAECRRRSDLERVDLFHIAAVELTYTGTRILSARYEVHVNGSTSFGESLVRHRLELSATSELVAEIFLNAKLIVQVNQFLDPLLLTGDTGTFVTIEDESRNALVLHATRDLGGAWTLEARYGLYTNPFSPSDLGYRRQTATLGAIYTFRSGP